MTDFTDPDVEVTIKPENHTYLGVDIARAVKEGSKCVYFRYMRDEIIWYMTDSYEMFPVPIADTAGATFGINMKAIMLMRWMRKWNGDIESAQIATHEGIPG